MRLDDGAHDRQTETTRIAVGTSPERLEHADGVLGLDARTVVAHLQDHLLAVGRNQLHADSRPGRRISSRILQQVGDRLTEEDRITVDQQHARRNLNLNYNMRQERGQSQGSEVDEFGEIDDLVLDFHRPCFDPTHAQQVSDQAVKPFGLVRHAFQQFVAGRFVV